MNTYSLQDTGSTGASDRYDVRDSLEGGKADKNAGNDGGGDSDDSNGEDACANALVAESGFLLR